MKKLFAVLLLFSFTALLTASHAQEKDHVPKVEKATVIEKQIQADAVVIYNLTDAIAPANDQHAIQVAAIESPPEAGSKSGSNYKNDERQRTESLLPRIRDKDNC
jgi:hypothetical protein